MGRHSEAGMTLVEVMVTLAIVAVMSGLAVLGLNGASRSATAEAEARRLASRIRLAADEALVTSSPLALQWDVKGYSFVRWDDHSRRWTPSEVDALGPRHRLPDGMSLEGPISDAPAPIAVEGVGPPLALDLKSRSSLWRVAFDGLNVNAASVR